LFFLRYRKKQQQEKGDNWFTTVLFGFYVTPQARKRKEEKERRGQSERGTVLCHEYES
jgi:hypothetical protein